MKHLTLKRFSLCAYGNCCVMCCTMDIQVQFRYGGLKPRNDVSSLKTKRKNEINEINEKTKTKIIRKKRK